MWWFMAVAHAQDRSPPASVTEAALEDLDAWEARSRALLDGPAGCVELQGLVQIRIALFSPGGWFGPGERRDLALDGRFEGRLDHGLWTALTTVWEETGKDGDELDMDRLHPIVGRLPAEQGQEGGQVSVGLDGSGTSLAVSQGSEQAVGMLDQILQDIDPSVTTGYALWDGDRRAVVLTQLVPLPRREGDLELSVVFPEGGPPLALDAIFPARVRGREGLIRYTLLDAQLHVRGQASELGVLPVEEGVSGVIGALGFTIGLDQRIRYERARACAGDGQP